MVFVAFLASGKKLWIEAEEMVTLADKVILLRNSDRNVALFQPEHIRAVVEESALSNNDD